MLVSSAVGVDNVAEDLAGTAIHARYGTVMNTGSTLVSNLTLTNTGDVGFDSGEAPVNVYVCFIRSVLWVCEQSERNIFITRFHSRLSL